MGSSSGSNKGKPRRQRKPKTICLPFPSQSAYQTCISDFTICRDFLLNLYDQHPELFPTAFSQSFSFHGFVWSKKQKLCTRRIKLKENGEVYQIRPSFMMPYMIGPVQAVENPLFLRRWGVPFEALAYVFGKYPMFWYRAYLSLGRASIVGSTLKDPSRLPDHLIADEKHSRLSRKKVFIPTTVAENCILGAEVVETAGTEDLKKGYGVFCEEAQNLNPDYKPKTVNTDKWDPTRNAWKALFSSTQLILCFLHAFLSIKDRCRRDHSLFPPLKDKIWHLYNAPTLACFAQRTRRLKDWTLPTDMPTSVKDKMLELCANADAYKRAYRYPGAYRTSNALERLMNYMDRLLYTAHYFHGKITSACLYVRAMALLWNFHPYDLRTQKKYGSGASPFERLNGFTYHHNWLENLMIAASLNGYRS